MKIFTFQIIIIIILLIVVYWCKNKKESFLDISKQKFCKTKCIPSYQSCQKDKDKCCDINFNCSGNLQVEKDTINTTYKCQPKKKKYNCSATNSKCNPDILNSCCSIYDTCTYDFTKKEDICLNQCDYKNIDNRVIVNELDYTNLIRKTNLKSSFNKDKKIINIDDSIYNTIGHYGSCNINTKNDTKNINFCQDNGVIKNESNDKNFTICREFSPIKIGDYLYCFGSTNEKIFTYLNKFLNNKIKINNLIGFTFECYIKQNNLPIKRIIIQIIDIIESLNIFDIWCPGSKNGKFLKCENIVNWDMSKEDYFNNYTKNYCKSLFSKDTKSLNSCVNVLCDLFNSNNNDSRLLNGVTNLFIEINKIKLINTPYILFDYSHLYFDYQTLLISNYYK